MDISIVIPTWRGRDLLEAYLPSIVAASDFYCRSRTRTESSLLRMQAMYSHVLKEKYADRVPAGT
jgi:hypothetical protein